MKNILLYLAIALFVSIPAWGATSTIDPTIPAQASPFSSLPVRTNFRAAYNDINTLYSTYNGFVVWTGPTALRTFTLPDASATLLYTGGPLGTPSSGSAANLTGLPLATGITGFGTGVEAFLAAPSSSNLLSALTTSTGTGNAVFSASPLLSGTGSATLADDTTQPLILTGGGSPAAGNLYGLAIEKSGTDELFLGINKSTATNSVPGNALYLSSYLNNSVLSFGRGNGSGLPGTMDFEIDGSGNGVFANGLTVTGHDTLEGVTSTGATGTGNFVFQTSPTLTTPVLGVASATTINKVTLTAPASGATLTISDGKTLTSFNTVSFNGNDAASVNYGAGGTIVYAGNADPGHMVITSTGTFTNNATPAALAGISYTVVAGATYDFDCWLHGTSGATGGTKIVWAGGSATITSGIESVWNYNGTTLNSITTTTSLGSTVITPAIYTDIIIKGSVVINGGGTFILEGAQDVSNATATTFVAGSTCKIGRVS